MVVPSATVVAAPAATFVAGQAAPLMQTIAAPVTATLSSAPITVAAPCAAPVTTVVQTPSYVAPPVQYAPPAGVVVAPPAPPQPPTASLTAGIPNPEQILKQKTAYAAALDKQLEEAMETVRNETKIEKEMVAFKTKKDIALFDTQVDEQLVEQLAGIDEMATVQQCDLKKALVDRNIQLNAQASNLVSDYRMKVLQDELANKKREFEKAYVVNEVKLAQDFNRVAQVANTPTVAAVQPAGSTIVVAAPVAAPAVPATMAVAAAPQLGMVAAPSAVPTTTVITAPAAPMYGTSTVMAAPYMAAAPMTTMAMPATPMTVVR
jgi:hypothetical protein